MPNEDQVAALEKELLALFKSIAAMEKQIAAQRALLPGLQGAADGVKWNKAMEAIVKTKMAMDKEYAEAEKIQAQLKKARR